MTSERVLDHGISWGPVVVRRGDELALDIHVASGHADKDFLIPITEEHLAVLRCDLPRYLLVWQALHELGQGSRSNGRLVPHVAQLARRCLDTVCLGSEAEVERFLSDEHSAIAIELVSFGADYLTMRRGRWFDAGLPTAPEAPYDASLRAAEIRRNQARWTANVELTDGEEIPTDGLFAASASDIADFVERYFVGWPWPRADQASWGRINGITFRNQQHLHAVPLAETGDVDALRRLAVSLREEAQRRWAAHPDDAVRRFDATQARTVALHAVFADMLQRAGATTAEWWPLGERAVALVEVQAEDRAQLSLWVVHRALVDRPVDIRRLAARVDWRSFLFDYDRAAHSPLQTSRDEALVAAMRNPVPANRVRIASELLDDGADASYESGPGRNARKGAVNALHLLFDEPTHDYELEAELLERLLDGGADINLRDHRLGTPLQRLVENAALDDSELSPFYDVLFARPDLDFEYVVTRIGDRPVTLRELVDRGGRPELARRLIDYYEAKYR